MEPLLSQLVNLQGIVVESFQETETDLMLEVEAGGQLHPRCSSSSNLHQNHGYWVQTCYGNRQVRLKVNRRQFKCKT